MATLYFGRLLLAACLLLPAFESTATPAVAPLLTETSTSIVVPANTIVELEMVDTVSSVTSKPGDLFHLRVTTAVMSGSTVLIPTGTPAIGQVVHATRAGVGGKAGELILAARYLETPQGQIKLRSSFGAAGKNRVGAAVVTSVAIGVLGVLIRGKHVELPAGSPLSARLASDTAFPGSP